MYGKAHTDAVKKKISELHSKSYDERFGKEKSSEIRKKMSESKKGVNNHSYCKEVKKKKCDVCNKEVDIRNYSRWHGDKCTFKEKLPKRPKTGFNQSNSTKKKISVALKGRTFSEEHKEKLRTSLKNSRNLISKEVYTCEFCGKNLNKSGYKRWHGEKCSKKLV